MLQPDLSFIHKYFMAEKQESLLFMIIGATAFALSAIFFFFIKTNPAFFKGAAIPVFVIGLLLVITGYTVYTRSDGQRMDAAYKMGLDASSFARSEELPRMKKVMKNFITCRYTEIALLLVGTGLFVYFRAALPFLSSWGVFWKGFGLALAVMALIALFADYFAEKRGSTYTKQIESFIQQ